MFQKNIERWWLDLTMQRWWWWWDVSFKLVGIVSSLRWREMQFLFIQVYRKASPKQTSFPSITSSNISRAVYLFFVAIHQRVRSIKLFHNKKVRIYAYATLINIFFCIRYSLKNKASSSSAQPKTFFIMIIISPFIHVKLPYKIP